MDTQKDLSSLPATPSEPGGPVPPSCAVAAGSTARCPTCVGDGTLTADWHECPDCLGTGKAQSKLWVAQQAVKRAEWRLMHAVRAANEADNDLTIARRVVASLSSNSGGETRRP